VIFAAWDAEEYGLIGSAAFVDRHTAALRDELLAYVNIDAVVSVQRRSQD
jgi:Zn-dependent M28 family amino/carboxypeptidase